jgi:hypothetical protein
VDTVRFKFMTGQDDLRDDSQLVAQFVFNDGSTLSSTLHRAGEATWGDDTLHVRDVDVSGRPPITQVVLQFFQGSGGFFRTGDNWNMQSIEVYADGVEDEAHTLFRATGDRTDAGCVHRFKGDFESTHASPLYRFFPNDLPMLRFFSRRPGAASPPRRVAPIVPLRRP